MGKRPTITKIPEHDDLGRRLSEQAIRREIRQMIEGLGPAELERMRRDLLPRAKPGTFGATCRDAGLEPSMVAVALLVAEIPRDLLAAQVESDDPPDVARLIRLGLQAHGGRGLPLPRSEDGYVRRGYRALGLLGRRLRIPGWAVRR
jgi:hypothetical protein